MEKSLQNNSGMILILAMLIIATVLATAAIFGNLIIKEIQQSRLIDQSIQAYYVAESGVERALHQTRKREAVKPDECGLIQSGSSCDENTGFCLGTSVPCITKEQGSLAEVVSNWQVEVTNESETSVHLKKGDSFQLDLFSPFQSQGSNITQVMIDSNIENFKLYGEFTNLTKVLNLGCADQPPVFKGFIESPTPLSGLDGRDILPNCSYIFRVSHPLNSPDYSDVVTFTVFNDIGEQVDIPSRLIIESTATYGDSLQKVTVRTPMRPPLSGLYDFVLFSEEEIIK